MMDNDDRRSDQPTGEEVPNGHDWRELLPDVSRQRIVNKIMATLERHLSFPGPEGLNELRKTAARFEERVFNSASSQPDYLRTISLKMLTMENQSLLTMENQSLLTVENQSLLTMGNQSQSSVADAVPTRSSGDSSNPPDPNIAASASTDNETSDIAATVHSSTGNISMARSND